MSDEPKNPRSVTPPPTDEIDEEWTGGGAAPVEPPAKPAAAQPVAATPAAPSRASTQDDLDEDEDDEDEDDEDDEDEDDESEDQDDAHTKSTRAESGSNDPIPEWGPWAVLGVLLALGLFGGLGGLSGVVKLDSPRPEEAPEPATSVAAAAAAPTPSARVRPLASARREIDPKDLETVEASHLLVAYKGSRRAQPTVTRTKEEAKKRAEQALAKAKKKGADFAAVVAEYSDEPRAAERGGRLGAFTRRRMAKEFSDAAFALEPGELSGIVETPFGYHVILRTK